MTSTTAPSTRGLRAFGRRLLRRANRYTLWAFNPQPELTSRYDRG
jgi:hypothetical protein